MGGDKNTESDKLATVALEAIHVIAIFDFRSTAVYHDFEYNFLKQYSKVSINRYTTFYYDAVMLLASSVDNLIKSSPAWLQQQISASFFQPVDGKNGFTKDLVKAMTTAPWYEGTITR